MAKENINKLTVVREDSYTGGTTTTVAPVDFETIESKGIPITGRMLDQTDGRNAVKINEIIDTVNYGDLSTIVAGSNIKIDYDEQTDTKTINLAGEVIPNLEAYANARAKEAIDHSDSLLSAFSSAIASGRPVLQLTSTDLTEMETDFRDFITATDPDVELGKIAVIRYMGTESMYRGLQEEYVVVNDGVGLTWEKVSKNIENRRLLIQTGEFITAKANEFEVKNNEFKVDVNQRITDANAATNTKINDFKATVNSQVAGKVDSYQYNTAVNLIQVRANQIESRVVTNENDVTDLLADKIIQDGKISTLETKATQATNGINTLDGRIDTLESDNISNKDRLDSLESVNLTPRVEALEQTASANVIWNNEQEAKITTNTSDIAALKTFRDTTINKDAVQDTQILNNSNNINTHTTQLGLLAAEMTTTAKIADIAPKRQLWAAGIPFVQVTAGTTTPSSNGTELWAAWSLTPNTFNTGDDVTIWVKSTTLVKQQDLTDKFNDGTTDGTIVGTAIQVDSTPAGLRLKGFANNTAAGQVVTDGWKVYEMYVRSAQGSAVDTTAQAGIATLTQNLATEIATRTTLSNDFNVLKTTVGDATAGLVKKANDNATAIAAEVQRATGAEGALSTRIDAKADTTALTAGLALKANQATTYTKTETDAKIADAVAAIDIPDVDLTAYSTTTQMNEALALKADTTFMNTQLNRKADANLSNVLSEDVLAAGIAAGLATSDDLNNKFDAPTGAIEQGKVYGVGQSLGIEAVGQLDSNTNIWKAVLGTPQELTYPITLRANREQNMWARLTVYGNNDIVLANESSTATTQGPFTISQVNEFGYINLVVDFHQGNPASDDYDYSKPLYYFGEQGIAWKEAATKVDLSYKLSAPFEDGTYLVKMLNGASTYEAVVETTLTGVKNDNTETTITIYTKVV